MNTHRMKKLAGILNETTDLQIGEVTTSDVLSSIRKAIKRLEDLETGYSDDLAYTYAPTESQLRELSKWMANIQKYALQSMKSSNSTGT